MRIEEVKAMIWFWLVPSVFKEDIKVSSHYACPA